MMSFFIVFAFASLLITVSHLSKKHDITLKSNFIEAPLSNIKPEQVRVLLLNKKNIYDDFLQIWLLQQLFPATHKADPAQLMTQIRSVLKHSPQIETLYLVSCIVMFKDYGKPENCLEISVAGLKAFPGSWRIPMLQGYVHAFLLKEPGLASSFYAKVASLPISPPPYVKNIAEKLAKQEGLTLEDAKQNLDLILNQESSKMGDLFNKKKEE
jgi:hypothetical protein